MKRRAVARWVVVALPVAAAFAGDDLDALRKAWPGLERSGKVDACTRLLARADEEVLRLCENLLEREEDPVVEGELLRVVAAHAALDRLRPRVARLLVRRAEAHLGARARREAREFADVCRAHGRKIPPGGAPGEGREWTDPWDEEARPLPEEARHERLRARALVAALARLGPPEAVALLLRILREHHDPEVVVSCVRAVGEWGLRAALPDLADLVRVEDQGRELGGADVIGRERYEELRLRWDVHKERLWWSRPEYLPRAREPILEEAGRLAGRGPFRTARELDRWILDHEEELAREGIRLESGFRRRASASAR